MSDTAGYAPRNITTHTPVLLHEVLDFLAPQSDDVVVDGTFGGGGHARAICSILGPTGRYVGFDADRTALARAGAAFADDSRVTLVCANFRSMASELARLGVEHVSKLLLDLGLSSDQLTTPSDGVPRGFTFSKDEPLHMTLSADPEKSAVTAYTVVNEWSEESLADIIYGFGGERRSRAIARAIVAAREECLISTTHELANVVRSAVPSRGRIDPATKTFQAIRIAVNDELGSLAQVLADMLPRMRPGGRIAVISFHSLEDGLVKRTFKEWATKGEGTVLTKRPAAPSREEERSNPRARSAKLRVFERAGA